MASATFFKTPGLKQCSSSRRAVLRGEKVPPAGGTVADRLVEGDDLAGRQGERPVVAFHRTTHAAGRAGSISKGLGLLFQESGDGAFGHTGGDQGRELLDVHEVDGRIRAEFRAGPLGRTFPPRHRQLVKLGQKLRCEFDCRHGASCTVLAVGELSDFLLPY
jgi:hypothetical protein